MDFQFAIKDPEKAYLGTQLWLPRRLVNTVSIKASLEFEMSGEEGMHYVQLWEDSPSHIAVPREYILPEDYETLSFPIVDLRPTEFPRTDFKSHLVLDAKEPDKDTQRRAFKALMESDGGLLNLACGKGKTCIALHGIAHMGRNALIIVNQKTILDQWAGAVEKFLEYDGGIGLIQGNPESWDWRHPITIATLQTLAIYSDYVTPEMRRWFGTIVWDEVHHLSAPFFCVTATMFPGTRIGLTATAEREDGMEVVFLYNLGEVFYKDLTQTVKPTIIFRQTPFTIPADDWLKEIIDKRGNPNISKLRTYVGQLEERNDSIAKDITDALRAGRKVLALSHSKKQIKLMVQKFLAMGVDCAACTSDEEVKKRWSALRDKQLIFGTHQLILEAIDEDSLDTLVWLTPFGSQHPLGGKNALQQGMGRIQGYRYGAGMKQPMVIIFDDLYIQHFHRMCNKLRMQLRRWPVEEGGPYEYKIVKPHMER